MNVSLVSGWLPVGVECLAVATLVLALDWGSTTGRHRLGIGLAGAVLVTGAVAGVLAITTWASSEVPWRICFWVFTLTLAVCVTVLGWGSDGRSRRGLAVAAVVLGMLVVVGTINEHADAFPTVGRLLSLDPENVVGQPDLVQLQDQVRASGHLPDQGVVIQVTIPPVLSGFVTRPAFVYLPPAWFAPVTPALPTLVLLPGEPGSASDWSDQGQADTIADTFARTHGGRAPIIVMPDPDGVKTDDTECVNSRFGAAETYLVDDVPDYVRSRFHASTAAGSLAVGGLSAGGTCSTMLALRHPQVYPTFASYSGFASPQYEETTRSQTIDILFGGSMAAFAAHDPLLLMQYGHFAGTAGWFEVGSGDPVPLAAARQLEPAAHRAGISTCLVVRPGGHDFDLWRQALQDSLPWLSWRLGLTAEPRDEPATCRSP